MSRRGTALLIAAWGWLAAAHLSAQGLGIEVTPAQTAATLGANSTITLTWEVDLGPVNQQVTVDSSAGRLLLDNFILRATAPLPTRTHASGIVFFTETVVIRSDEAARALTGSVPAGRLFYRRRFEARSTGGLLLSGVGHAVVTVPSPTLDVSVRPPTTTFGRCDGRATVTWTVSLTDGGGLRVASDHCTFITDTTRRRCDQPPLRFGLIDGRASRSETVLVPSAARFAAFRGETLRMERELLLHDGAAFSRRITAGVTLEPARRPDQPAVVGEPATRMLSASQPNAIRIEWHAQHGEPCERFTSEEIQLRSLPPGIVPNFTQQSALAFAGDGRAVDMIEIPPSLVTAAVAGDADAITLTRAFARHYDIDGVASGSFAVTASPLRFALPPPRPTLPPFEITRVAIRFLPARHVFASVARGAALTIEAELSHTGNGLLEAEWEVADPATAGFGDAGFRTMGLVRRSLLSGGTTVIAGPVLDTSLLGLYRVRLRIDTLENQLDVPEIQYAVVENPDQPSPPVPPPVWPPPDPNEDENDDPDFLPNLLPRPSDDEYGRPPVDPTDMMVEREVLVLSADVEEAKALEEEMKKLQLDVKARYVLEALDLVLTVLRVPESATVAQVVAELRRRYESLWVDANHLYELQSTPVHRKATDRLFAHGREVGSRLGFELTCERLKIKIGLIDTPADLDALGLADSKNIIVPDKLRGKISSLATWRSSTSHATTMIGLLLGNDGQNGLFPNAEVYLANVVRRTHSGLDEPGKHDIGVVEAAMIGVAADWLVENNVDIVLLPVAGPLNATVTKILKTGLAKGEWPLIAPFNLGRNSNKNSFPASASWTFGGTSLSSDDKPHQLAPPARKLGVPELIGEELTCQSSCSLPFIAAAVSRLLDERPPAMDEDRADWLNEKWPLHLIPGIGNIYRLTAPPCPPSKESDPQ